MKAVRLLHTSDVHLGGGFRAPADGDHHDHCLCPLTALERTAESLQVDAVLVVGDLFDNKRITEDFVATVMNRLGNLGVPCVVICGNHDVHDETTLYRPHTLTDGSGSMGLTYLDDADGTVVDLLDGGLKLWGKAMPMHHPGFRPLGDSPDRPSDDSWWVVLGHGHFEPGDAGALARSSPLSPEEIAATEADYVALGHWHVRTDVSTDRVPAWYSGAPYGVGATQSFNVIDLHPENGVSVSSAPVELAVEGCLSR